MTTTKIIAAGLLALVCGVGCYPTQYSSIERAEDGSYLVTKNQAGFFRVHGELWQCKPSGDKMVCTKVGTD